MGWCKYKLYYNIKFIIWYVVNFVFILLSKFKFYNMIVVFFSNLKVNFKIKYSGLKLIDFFCK